MRKRKTFTLIELIVVMVIISMTTAIAVTVFKGESPARLLERSSFEFESFCSRVRYQAMENASDRAVVYDQENRRFLMKIPSHNDSSEDEYGDENIFAWNLPEEFDFTNASPGNSYGNDFTEDFYGMIEIFRFYPNGSAEGSRRLVLQYRNMRRTFEVSGLTGFIRMYEGEENI